MSSEGAGESREVTVLGNTTSAVGKREGDGGWGAGKIAEKKENKKRVREEMGVDGKYLT